MADPIDSLGARWAESNKHLQLVVPQCEDCAHYQGEAKCAAYPDGIPAEILVNEHDHTKPFPQDHGIRFVKK